MTEDPESGDEVGWCPSCGGYMAAEWKDMEVVDATALPLADEALCEKHNKVEVPVVVFEGSGGSYTERRTVTVPDGGFVVVPVASMR